MEGLLPLAVTSAARVVLLQTASVIVDFTYRNSEEADPYTILESLGGGAWTGVSVWASRK